MKAATLDAELLRRFSPLDGLRPENLAAVVGKLQIRELSPKQVLFKEGDTARRKVYIVSGTFQLLAQGKVVDQIKGGTEQARNPVADLFPRRVTGRARNRVQYIAIDSELLDVMLTWDQTGSYEVSEFTGGAESAPDDWMTTVLQAKAFHRIPPANIQMIFMRMQQLDYKAGDVIVKQGSPGDFFYVLTSGKCRVTRETPLNKSGILLAELGAGDTFGEEALISDARRNATITMLQPGTVMRLGKDDFQTLMNEPMLTWVSYEEGAQIVKRGGQWLDVRLPSEFENRHFQGAINLPLYFMRLKINTLDKSKNYVLCCDTGRRSSAGAYILSERGYKTCILRDGIASAEQ